MKSKIKDAQLISNMLKELGVPAHILGYDYAFKAVELCAEDKSYIHKITKILYPEIAKKFNTTPSRVERAIRHAVGVAFDRCNPDLIKEYFGYSIDHNKDRPTNGEFIAVIAERYNFMRGVS